MFRKTVNDVVKSFQKNIEDLRTIAEREELRAQQLENQAVALQVQADGALAEANCADRIADRLADLLS